MEWFKDEVKSCELGDVRLRKRLEKLLARLGAKPTASIPGAHMGWGETQAAYRFFANEKVCAEKILEGHYSATIERLQACKVILLPQDTTEISFILNKGNKGIGTLKAFEKVAYHLHTQMAFTPERINLGVLGAHFWQREEKKIKKEQRVLPLTDKESGRWLEGYQRACEIQALLPETQVVSISDREGDIFECFLEFHEHASDVRADFIIRANQDRRIVSGDKQSKKLKKKLSEAAVLGEVDVSIPRKPGKAARRAKMTVRACSVRFSSLRRNGCTLAGVTVNAVISKEENPPAGEEALEWLLLTSLPIQTFEQVKTVLEWYVCRWEIEIYFRVLKSGCTVEELQLETARRIQNCIAIYMIVAWRVHFLTMIGRWCPDLSCEAVFCREEWQALYITLKRASPPPTAPLLNEILQMIASIGGYLGRKGDGFPGPKSIWIGLQRTRDFVMAIQSYNALSNAM